eukprot:GDKJ01018178.1.p1 GENE.GDKJ01018178.1~~GDKJ01018178.1.p1  ORF type:complete len:797 (+),score=271.27 GDKJ01018178.1:291-2393(+)
MEMHEDPPVVSLPVIAKSDQPQTVKKESTPPPPSHPSVSSNLVSSVSLNSVPVTEELKGDQEEDDKEEEEEEEVEELPSIPPPYLSTIPACYSSCITSCSSGASVPWTLFDDALTMTSAPQPFLPTETQKQQQSIAKQQIQSQQQQQQSVKQTRFRNKTNALALVQSTLGANSVAVANPSTSLSLHARYGQRFISKDAYLLMYVREDWVSPPVDLSKIPKRLLDEIEAKNIKFSSWGSMYSNLRNSLEGAIDFRSQIVAQILETTRSAVSTLRSNLGCSNAVSNANAKSNGKKSNSRQPSKIMTPNRCLMLVEDLKQWRWVPSVFWERFVTGQDILDMFVDQIEDVCKKYGLELDRQQQFVDAGQDNLGGGYENGYGMSMSNKGTSQANVVNLSDEESFLNNASRSRNASKSKANGRGAAGSDEKQLSIHQQHIDDSTDDDDEEGDEEEEAEVDAAAASKKQPTQKNESAGEVHSQSLTPLVELDGDVGAHALDSNNEIDLKKIEEEYVNHRFTDDEQSAMDGFLSNFYNEVVASEYLCPHFKHQLAAHFNTSMKQFDEKISGQALLYKASKPESYTHEFETNKNLTFKGGIRPDYVWSGGMKLLPSYVVESILECYVHEQKNFHSCEGIVKENPQAFVNYAHQNKNKMYTGWLANALLFTPANELLCGECMSNDYISDFVCKKVAIKKSKEPKKKTKRL